jgi:rhamnose transport system substrate-binding protein
MKLSKLSLLTRALLPLLTVLCATAFGAGGSYDGGQPSNPKDLKGKKIVLVDVPKLVGIGYFAATTKGMAEAAAELSKNNLPTEVKTDAPTEADIQKQIEYIDNAISRGVDGILFASNDPVAISPVLRKALKGGIHVIGYDAESQPDAREWFVQQATPDGIAKALIDSMVAEELQPPQPRTAPLRKQLPVKGPPVVRRRPRTISRPGPVETS